LLSTEIEKWKEDHVIVQGKEKERLDKGNE
jgi:hypothetical protein